MVRNEVLEPCGLTTKSFIGWLKWVKEHRIKKNRN